MIDLDRIPKLQALVKLLDNHIESKKKLHKLVYLLQQAGEDFGYRYIYHSYGVFSPELASDLDTARQDSVLSVERRDDNGMTVYDIRYPSENPLNISDPGDIACDHGLIKELGGRSAAFLEALSTVVYLGNNYYSGTDLRSKLTELKPGLERHFEQAYEFARDKFEVQV